MAGALQFGNKTVLTCFIVSWEIITVSQDIYQVRLCDINNYFYIGFEGSYNGVIAYIEELKKKLVVEIIQLSPPHYFSPSCTIKLNVGEIRFPHEITYDDKPIIGEEFQREIVNSQIAEFDKDGNLVGKKVGNTTATIRNNGVSETFEIVVIDNSSGLRFESDNYTIDKWDTVKIKVYSGNEEVSDNIPKEFYVEKKDTIRVDGSGNVTGLKVGTSKLFVKIYDITLFTNITIDPTTPMIEKRTVNVNVSSTKQLTLPVTEGYTGQKWISEKPEIVSVVQGTGVITGEKVGKCIVRGYRTSPYEAQCVEYTVTVIQPPPPPQSENEEIYMKTGTTFNGKLPVNSDFSGADWDSDKPTVATVDAQSGLIEAVSEGIAIVTGKYNKPYVTNGIEYMVNVLDPPKIVPESLHLTVNQQHKAEMPVDINFKGAKWSASNDVVTVDPNTGMITAKKTGNSVVIGKFTTPFEVDGKKYTIDVVDVPQG